MKAKTLSTVLFLASFAVGTLAAAGGLPPEEPGQGGVTEPKASPKSGVHLFPAPGVKRHERILTSGTNLAYHGGPVIPSARVVYIFWGPTFSSVGSADYTYAQTLQSFRNQLGTTPEYTTITQYSGSNGSIALTNLAAGTADWFDTSLPPTDVTDALLQAEVNTYISSHGFNASTIYEVVLPDTSYADFGGQTSCGGPNLQFCAYHGYFTSGANVVKYSVQPYTRPNCCSTSGWTAVQNQEHFVDHETREAVTDPQPNSGWVDTTGLLAQPPQPVEEADDKCAWSPTPFFGTGGYGYQYEWSNALSACVRSTIYEGYHEVANCRGISGWAWDQTQPNTAINVSLDRDSSQVATVAANIFRSDLLSAGKGNGYHGFSYTPDSSWKNGQWHSARVRFSTTGTSLNWSPISFLCNVSIFTTQTPVDDLSTGGQVYSVGTQFRSSQNGYITQLGFYRGAGETGTNTLRLWTDGGSQLASVAASCGGSGWCWAAITPVAITGNTLYRVSVNTNSFQSKTNCGIGSGITNQVLTAPQGFWAAGDTFPTTASCSNFFVDVKFDM